MDNIEETGISTEDIIKIRKIVLPKGYEYAADKGLLGREADLAAEGFASGVICAIVSATSYLKDKDNYERKYQEQQSRNSDSQ